MLEARATPSGNAVCPAHVKIDGSGIRFTHGLIDRDVAKRHRRIVGEAQFETYIGDLA